MEIGQIQQLQTENLQVYKEKEDLNISRIKEETKDTDKKTDENLSFQSQYKEGSTAHEIAETFKSLTEIRELKSKSQQFTEDIKDPNSDISQEIDRFEEYLEQSLYNKEAPLATVISEFSGEIKNADFINKTDNKIRYFQEELNRIEEQLVQQQQDSLQSKYIEPVDAQGNEVFVAGSLAAAQANIHPNVARSLLT